MNYPKQDPNSLVLVKRGSIMNDIEPDNTVNLTEAASKAGTLPEEWSFDDVRQAILTVLAGHVWVRQVGDKSEEIDLDVAYSLLHTNWEYRGEYLNQKTHTIDTMTEQLNEMSALKNRYYNRAEALKRENAELITKLGEHKQKIQSLVTNLDEHGQRIQSLEGRLASTRTQLETVKKVNDMLRQHMRQAAQHIMNARVLWWWGTKDLVAASKSKLLEHLGWLDT